MAIILNIWFWRIQLFWWMILVLLDAQIAGDSDFDTYKFLKVTWRYLGICNLLYNIIWNICAIPTYRVYWLYDNLQPTSLLCDW